MTVDICLFRHGRTIWNAEGRYQGHADVELDDLGRGQALAVAQRCIEISGSALYSSDLQRCSDVGAKISDATGLEMKLDARLRERNVGKWSGLTRSEISDQFPDEYAAWRAGEDNVRPGGGESLGDVAGRLMAFMDDIVSRHDGETVIVVTHSGWIRSVMQWVLGPHCPRNSFGMPTQGSLTVVRLDSQGHKSLEAFNDRGHLLAVEPIDREPQQQISY